MTRAAVHMIKERLQEFDEKQLQRSIENFSKDEWQMKHNVHRPMKWFFATEDRIEEFLNLKSKSSRISLEALEQQIEKDNQTRERLANSTQ